MRNRFWLCWTLALFLLFNASLLYPDSTNVKYLSLQFGDVDSPPYCFIPHKRLKRPKVGLALSGGGARGFAQIGVLEVFEQENIPVDFIVGTSMGSVVGGLYAAGYSPFQIEKIAKEIDWTNIMVDKPPRTSLFVGQKQERSRAILQLRFNGLKLELPRAITPGQKLTSILTNLTLRADFQTSSNFDLLKIPYRALACDLISGKKVLLQRGNLAEAMKSSFAVPLLFAPVANGDMLLVDGGLINNIPVDELREFNVDLAIAIDTSSELNDKESLQVPWKVADQVTTIMQQEKIEQQRKKADVLIKPPLEEYKSDSFQAIEQLIEIGRQEGRKYIQRIKQLIKQNSKNALSGRTYPVGSVQIIAANDTLKNEVRQKINSYLGTSISYEDIYQSLTAIYQLGYFRDVKAECRLSDSVLAVTYLLEPNPSFSVIQFDGNSVFPDSLLSTLIESKPDTPINYYTSKNDVAKIVALYKNEGYSLVSINDIQLRNDTLYISLNEGKISSIVIEGNKRTKQFVILREFPLKEGDIFNINAVDKGINNIYSTNLFKIVSLEVAKQHQQAQLKIKVDEKAFSLIRLGYRYDLERKNKAMIELVDENFIGSANQITLHGQYGARDKIVQFKFRSDRIFKTFLTTNFDIYYHQLNNYVYSAGEITGEYVRKENGMSISFGRQIERLGVFSIMATAKNIELASLSGYGYPTGKYDLRTISLQSIVDTQDKYPFPNKGKYYQFFYKMSSATFLNSQTSFFKLFSSFEFYHTFFKRNTIHPKLFWGTSDLTTPFIEQFRLGGQSLFFGLRENERIGRNIIVGSFEYRYQFPFGFPIDFYLSLRYDIGATWKHTVDINPKDFDHSFGLSLSLNTPVGPISLSVGKLNDQRNVAYFSAGFEF